MNVERREDRIIIEVDGDTIRPTIIQAGDIATQIEQRIQDCQEFKHDEPFPPEKL